MKRLSRDELVKSVPKAREVQTALDLVWHEGKRLTVPLSSLLALHAIHDLYDDTSSDAANLARIRYSLEVAMSELESIHAVLGRMR